MPETTASKIAEGTDGNRAGRGPEAQRLRDISPQQWRSGIAAWLGWTFDGLDMHLYTLVATPFVAELLNVDAKDDAVGYYSSLIQGAFLLGWALGGGAVRMDRRPSGPQPDPGAHDPHLRPVHRRFVFRRAGGGTC